jgi:hypothetical protein
MRKEDASAIVRKFLVTDDWEPCHIESLRFIPAEDPSEKPHWAAVIAFDVSDDDIAYFCTPIVSVDDETGEVSVMPGL